MEKKRKKKGSEQDWLEFTQGKMEKYLFFHVCDHVY